MKLTAIGSIGKQGCSFTFDVPVSMKNREGFRAKEWWMSWQALASLAIGCDIEAVEAEPPKFEEPTQAVYTVWRRATTDEGNTSERNAANILASMSGGKVVEMSDRFEIVKP